jgi:predicted small secreted protein
LAGVTKRIWVVAVVVLSAALLASCTSSDTERGAATESTGAQPGPAVEEYLDILLPGLAAMKELDQLDPDLYASLVRDFREGGLEALTDADRSKLLLVAQVAFLSHVETVRWSVTSGDVSAGAEPSHHGEATVEEIYVSRPYPPTGSTVSRLAARRGKTDSIGWSWGLTPYWDPDCRGELLLFVDFVSAEQGSEEDTAIITEWAEANGQWVCYRNAPTSSYRYYAAELDYWGTFVRLASAILSGRDTLDGQPTYRLEDYQDRSVQYWLDTDTLWLRQYQYEDSSGALITVKLEAINEDIHIEPPDVDVPCAQEE